MTTHRTVYRLDMTDDTGTFYDGTYPTRDAAQAALDSLVNDPETPWIRGGTITRGYWKDSSVGAEFVPED